VTPIVPLTEGVRTVSTCWGTDVSSAMLELFAAAATGLDDEGAVDGAAGDVIGTRADERAVPSTTSTCGVGAPVVDPSVVAAGASSDFGAKEVRAWGLTPGAGCSGAGCVPVPRSESVPAWRGSVRAPKVSGVTGFELLVAAATTPDEGCVTRVVAGVATSVAEVGSARTIVGSVTARGDAVAAAVADAGTSTPSVTVLCSFCSGPASCDFAAATVGTGAGELGAGELGAGESGAGELGAGELGAGELGAGESGAGELG
jgi:hypothetical protein